MAGRLWIVAGGAVVRARALSAAAAATTGPRQSPLPAAAAASVWLPFPACIVAARSASTAAPRSDRKKKPGKKALPSAAGNQPTSSIAEFGRGASASARPPPPPQQQKPRLKQTQRQKHVNQAKERRGAGSKFRQNYDLNRRMVRADKLHELVAVRQLRDHSVSHSFISHAFLTHFSCISGLHVCVCIKIPSLTRLVMYDRPCLSDADWCLQRNNVMLCPIHTALDLGFGSRLLTWALVHGS